MRQKKMTQERLYAMQMRDALTLDDAELILTKAIKKYKRQSDLSLYIDSILHAISFTLMIVFSVIVGVCIAVGAHTIIDKL